MFEKEGILIEGPISPFFFYISGFDRLLPRSAKGWVSYRDRQFIFPEEGIHAEFGN